MKSINPVNNEIINDYQEISIEEALIITAQTDLATNNWIKKGIDDRCRFVSKVAENLELNKSKLANLITQEMGKLYKESVAEIDKCISLCDFYSNRAKGFLQDEYLVNNNSNSIVCYQPLGIILGIMPWNYPFWQAFRFAIPALLAGNCCLLKHSSNVTGCALAIERIIQDSSDVDSIFRTLVMDSEHVEELISNELISGVSFTGGTEAGRAVAIAAAKHLKKVVLELGGSDPYIILKDADLELAAEMCVKSRLINAGQSCVAAKRFIIESEVYDEFLSLFLDKMKKIKIGDPIDENVDMGPMASTHHRDYLHSQVEKAIKFGAKCILGGEVSDIPGAYYSPTILTDLVEGMPGYEDELFGPVAVVIKVSGRLEAISVANSSKYGLGSAIFSKDIEQARNLAKNDIQAGICFVNGFVKSDPAMPFGGIKLSGYGRELSYHGIREFTNIKTLVIKP